MLSSGPFHETVTTTERPEINITDQIGDDQPSTVIFSNATGSYPLEVHKPSSSLTLPPGEYQWELQGALYRNTGTPDQTGTLVCRRFRRYDLFVYNAGPEGQSTHPRLGDQ